MPCLIFWCDYKLYIPCALKDHGTNNNCAGHVLEEFATTYQFPVAHWWRTVNPISLYQDLTAQFCITSAGNYENIIHIQWNWCHCIHRMDEACDDTTDRAAQKSAHEWEKLRNGMMGWLELLKYHSLQLKNIKKPPPIYRMNSSSQTRLISLISFRSR